MAECLPPSWYIELKERPDPGNWKTQLLLQFYTDQPREKWCSDFEDLEDRKGILDLIVYHYFRRKFEDKMYDFTYSDYDDLMNWSPTMDDLVEQNKSKIEKEYRFDKTAPTEEKMSDRGDNFDIDYDEDGNEVIVDHGNPKIDIVIKGDDDYIGEKDKDVGGRRTKRRKTRRTKKTKRRKTRGGKRSKKTRRR
jgi:hypothetical protein